MTNVAGISTHSLNGYLWAPLQRALHDYYGVSREPSLLSGLTIGGDFRFYGLAATDEFGVDDLTPQAKQFATYLEVTRPERERTGMLRPGEEDL
jgi:hypothetical protein